MSKQTPSKSSILDMSKRLDTLEKIAQQNAEQITQLFRIESKQNGEYVRMTEEYTKHTVADASAFQKINDFHTRMIPMVEVFENNNIVKATIKSDTNTIVFYVKSAGVIVGFLGGTWYFIRWLITVLPK